MSERKENLHGDLSECDAELAQRIAQTLDGSADEFDAETRAQLALVRHRALAYTRRKRFAGAVALAASVLALAATPWMLRQPVHEKIADDVAYLSVDPEMLADMDMLMAVGESQ